MRNIKTIFQLYLFYPFSMVWIEQCEKMQMFLSHVGKYINFISYLGFHKEDITSEYKLLEKRLWHTQHIKPNFIANYVFRLQGIMKLHLQQIFWAYTIVFSILILAIAEISCENEEQSLDENSNRFVRSIKATPLRWGKRNIEKRSTAEEEDGSSEELVGVRETRSSPLR